MRTLTTVEKHMTVVRHKITGTEVTITGTTWGGFVVTDKEGADRKLLFENVDNWEVREPNE